MAHLTKCIITVGGSLSLRADSYPYFQHLSAISDIPVSKKITDSLFKSMMSYITQAAWKACCMTDVVSKNIK